MKVNYLAFAISAALATSANVYAADENTKQVEEAIEVIEVMGVLSSLKEAQEVKKLSDNIVDALVAEDIGKFPDSNVAESLQRIPGVSVTRNNGEGQTVTVRGLTGNYNVTTLNGRTLASDHDARDFNYDVLASELVAGIQVHKTQKANLPEGAVGAVINIDTFKPLNIGRVANFSLEADYNERAEEVNPKASFLVSETFNDDTLGILFSMIHSELTTRYDAYSSDGNSHTYLFNDFTLEDSVPTTDEILRTPRYPKLYMTTSERERTSGTFALQWRPTNNFDVNFDALYSSYDINAQGKVLSAVIPRGDSGVFSDLTVGEAGYIESASFTPAAIELLESSDPRESKTYQVGLNLQYIYDQFTFNLDVAQSESENTNKGESNFVVIRTQVDSADIIFNNGSNYPDISLSQPIDDSRDYGAHYGRVDGLNINAKTSSFVFDGEYEPSSGTITKVMFGAGYNMQQKDRVRYEPANGSIFATDNMDKVNPSYDAEIVTIAGDDMWKLPANVVSNGGSLNFAGGKANVPSSWANVNVDNLFAFYKELDPVAYQSMLPQRENESADTYNVKEETTHLYTEIVLENTVFDMPWLLDIGARYIKTDITSSGWSQNVANLAFDSDGELANDNWKKTESVAFTGSYEKLLPSLNFKISLTDEVVFRIAASQTMSRPYLDWLRPNTSISPEIQPEDVGTPLAVRSISENDPGLKPFTADQFDTTLEWYYSENGNLAFATYFKKLNNFLNTDTSEEVVAGQNFSVSRPFNDSSKHAVIRGYELAWFQTFDDYLPDSLAGFGIYANYSYNNSTSGDRDDEGELKPFYGLSKNQYNVSVFYEQHGFTANLVYNYRDSYLAYDAWYYNIDIWDWDKEQANTGDWEDLGLSLSYEITDNLTASFDASNLLDPEWGEYTKENPLNILSASSFGRRYTLGVRYKF